MIILGKSKFAAKLWRSEQLIKLAFRSFCHDLKVFKCLWGDTQKNWEKKTRKSFNVVSIDDKYVNCIYLCNPLLRAICITTLILPRVSILLFGGVGYVRVWIRIRVRVGLRVKPLSSSGIFLVTNFDVEVYLREEIETILGLELQNINSKIEIKVYLHCIWLRTSFLRAWSVNIPKISLRQSVCCYRSNTE